MLEDSRRCTGIAHDGREMWYFGMTWEEKQAAKRCRRRKGHRGECSVHSQQVKIRNGKCVGYK